MGKQKKYLNGNLIIGSKLYNILYTSFCGLIMVLVLLSIAYTTTSFFTAEETPFMYYTSIFIGTITFYFLVSKLFSNDNYL